MLLLQVSKNGRNSSITGVTSTVYPQCNIICNLNINDDNNKSICLIHNYFQFLFNISQNKKLKIIIG